QATVTSLQAALQSATYRRDYYKGLLAEGWSGNERQGFALAQAGLGMRAVAATTNLISAPMWWVPTIYGFATGGGSPAAAVQAGAGSLNDIASSLSEGAGLANTQAGYERRAQDWQLQQELAQFDMAQVGAQLDAANRQASTAQMQFDLQEATF